MSRLLLIILTAGMVVMVGHAQPRRPASPAGSSAAQIGGVFDARTGYVNGRWIEIATGGR